MRGAVNPGEIVAWYPGLVYDLELVRHIPGYPKVSERNPYLVARYDGSVVDAKPWGAGGGAVDVDADACIVSSHTEAEEGRDGKLGSAFGSFGSWPDPPLDAKETAKETATEGEKTRRRGRVPGRAAGARPGPGSALGGARRGASVQRDNPLALAHFANHPPKGISPPQRRRRRRGRRVPRRPSRVAAPVPAQRRARGAAAEPTSREGVAARQAARAGAGWFAARLHDLFGKRTTTRRTRSPRRRRRRRRRCRRSRSSRPLPRRGGVPELRAEHARGAPGVVPPRGRGGGQEALGERLGVPYARRTRTTGFWFFTFVMVKRWGFDVCVVRDTRTRDEPRTLLRS